MTKFSPTDESDILAAERLLGVQPIPTGRLRLFKNGSDIKLLQLWEASCGPRRGYWLEVPIIDEMPEPMVDR